MLFELYVRSRYELRIIEELRLKKITAYCPQQIKAERHRGSWQYVERIIFTRYIFVDAAELNAKIWHNVMKCTGAIRFVSLCSLPPGEESYIRELCNGGECIDISRGYIFDGKLHITSGFLFGRDHEIIKFNRRGKRASADVIFGGEKHRVIFSVEFDDLPQRGRFVPPVLP